MPCPRRGHFVFPDRYGYFHCKAPLDFFPGRASSLPAAHASTSAHTPASTHSSSPTHTIMGLDVGFCAERSSPFLYFQPLHAPFLSAENDLRPCRRRSLMALGPQLPVMTAAAPLEAMNCADWMPAPPPRATLWLSKASKLMSSVSTIKK